MSSRRDSFSFFRGFRPRPPRPPASPTGDNNNIGTPCLPRGHTSGTASCHPHALSIILFHPLSARPRTRDLIRSTLSAPSEHSLTVGRRSAVSEGRRPGIIVIPGRRARRARRPGPRSTPPSPRVAARRHRGISTAKTQSEMLQKHKVTCCKNTKLC